ncbi:MAG: S8 family serine peptidase [Cyclobacteriaceae bacterium]
MKKGVILALCWLMGLGAMAQKADPGSSGLLNVRTEVFQKLQQNVRQYSLNQEEKVAIAEAKGIPLILSLDNGKSAHFQYLDQENHPVYYTTHNINAATTTGTQSMQSGGSLNLNLAGDGMIVGIYDQTRPRANHNEFGNRVTQLDGSTETISNHATHVTGTILAAGNNANARGMANQATGWAFNWDADVSKMTQNSYDPDLSPEGHLISNHSYGILIGWFRDSNGNWAWSGNQGVSANEDYRFGYYSNKSRQIDELAFAKPYYTIVWAAGNDRSDVGDGSRDSDGPDDSIGPEGVAKNNITVGAVGRVTNYTGPGDVQMSAFSSWGPVDDGRIKPDLVGMGVNVFSSSIVNDGEGDGYATLSGTSMASPNVTGSLLLLQELFHIRNGGRYMRSATLKALSIHTAKEAGLNPGPDYMFGWGLLDAEASANMIIEEDGSSSIIRELILEDNGLYEFEFISNGLDPIKATIAWTDPAGTPPSPSINPINRMLVNDLDMRIIDENGNEFFPWSLNPGDGSSAIAANTADNFRDNVEQIYLESPLPQRYTIRISHKINLVNGLQPFSLLFSAGVSDGQQKTLYWIGQDGSWENPGNWSLSNNGPSANQIPDEGTRVVIDRAAEPEDISLSQNSNVFSLNIFGENSVDLNLNGNELTISNSFRSSNTLTAIRNGLLHFESEDQNENILSFGQTTLTGVDLFFDSGRWRIISIAEIETLEIAEAEIEFDLSEITVNTLTLQQEAVLGGNIRNIEFSENIEIGENAGISNQLGFKFTGSEGLYLDQSESDIQYLIQDGGNLEVRSSGLLGTLQILSGAMKIDQQNTRVNQLELTRGSVLEISDGQLLTVVEEILHHETGQGNSLIKSAGKGTLVHEPYKKYCFQNLDIENVDFQGEAVINLGAGAQVSNADNWLAIVCENVLFPDFEVRFNCAQGITEFVNLSEGNVTSYNWNFGGLGTSTNENPTFIFNNIRTYPITLVISGPGGDKFFEKQVAISSNTLSRPNIVANGAQLTSRLPAGLYQWYRNGQPIPGATQRTYMVEDGGSYQVAVIDDQCNRISDVVVISSLGDETFAGRAGYAIGPNPVTDRLSLFINNDYRGKVEVRVFDSSGRSIEKTHFNKELQGMEFVMDFDFLQGLYLLQVQAGEEFLTFKVLKE